MVFIPKKDLEEARSVLYFQQVLERGVTEFINTVSKRGTQPINYELLFGPDHFKKAAEEVAKRIWQGFVTFGTFVAQCTGIYVVLLIVRTVIAQFLSATAIYEASGCTWRLLLAISP